MSRKSKIVQRPAAKPREGECCSMGLKPFETALSRCLVFDPFHPSGATHDVDPFGVYQTREDGTVVFRQVLRSSPGYIPCRTPEELDALIARVFLAAARHSRRHMVVTRDHVRSFAKGRVFCHPVTSLATSSLAPPPWYPVGGIPPNVILCVEECVPEDVGRLCYHCGSYGVSLMDPRRVSSLEVVPVPFGYGHRTDEVIA